jgi:poly-gamma-glutamate synthesis protein (capsule biosynthesis protein)
LKDAGFDLLSTANNHCNDKREAGLLRTLDVLDKIGLDHTGTFRTALEQDVITIKNINGIRFAVLSYTYGTNGIPLVAGHDFTVNLLDKDLIYDDIQRAKAQNPDFIIVMPHMGVEYAQKPGQEQRDLVRFMWESGADIVLASHPHVLQPMEFETVIDDDGTERLCFVDYSLGNFISSQRTLPRDAGCIVNLYFEKTKSEKAYLTYVSFIPTWVQFMNVSGAYDIKTLPVFDALSAPDGKFSEDDPGIRPKDIARLKNVQAEVTKIYLGKSVPLESMRSEYFVPTPVKRSAAPQGDSAQ